MSSDLYRRFIGQHNAEVARAGWSALSPRPSSLSTWKNIDRALGRPGLRGKGRGEAESAPRVPGELLLWGLSVHSGIRILEGFGSIQAQVGSEY